MSDDGYNKLFAHLAGGKRHRAQSVEQMPESREMQVVGSASSGSARLEQAIEYTGCSKELAQKARAITQLLKGCSVFWTTTDEDGPWIEWFDGKETLLRLFVLPNGRSQRRPDTET